jgi:hypothetical protein
MTSDIRSQIEALQRDAERVTQAHAGADAKLATARGRLEGAQADLQAEFGVSTAEEAEGKVEKLRAALESEAARVRQLLAQAGGA